MPIEDILKSDLSVGAKLIAIAVVNGARTAREAAEACSMNLRTAERHYADARILLRNIAYPTPQICVVDTQECVPSSRAHKLSEEIKKPPISPAEQLELTEPEPKPKAARKLADMDGFDDWYALYPKKTSKAAAEKAWPKAVQRAGSPEPIINALKQQLPTLKTNERKYIKDPATWLNKACWEDEFGAPKKFTLEELNGKSRTEIMRMMRAH